VTAADQFLVRCRKLASQIPLLDRWILLELSAPLMFGVGAFTAVSFSVGAVFELLRKIAESSVSLTYVIRILLLQLPAFMVLSFPMATLMATLLSYGKLSSTSELTALRSIGVSAWRMVLPGLALAFTMTVLTFTFNEWIVPQTTLQSKALLNQAVGKAVVGQNAENVTYSKFGPIKGSEGKNTMALTTFFSAAEYINGEMRGITVLDLSNINQQILLQAKTGIWDISTGQWHFSKGRVTVLPSQGNDQITTGDFDRYTFTLGAEPIETTKLPKDFDVFSNTLTIGQARTAERLLRESGQTKRARKFRVRIQEKFSFPAVCLVFGLLGASLGVRPTSRRSTSQGFGLTVIFLFIYYILAYMFSTLGVNGVLPPVLAAWTPVLLGLSTGGWLLHRASQ
jgi:lipopolysaccharide export system permease protein